MAVLGFTLKQALTLQEAAHTPGDAVGESGPCAIKAYKGGNYCIRTDVRATLLRKRPLNETTMVIEPNGGVPVSVVWTQNQSMLDWPAQLDVIDRDSYTLRFDGSASATSMPR